MISNQRELQALYRNDLTAFFARAWKELEPSEYDHNWHIECMAKHLEAVERGDIKRLIINVPPRTAKTLLVNIVYPAWIIGRKAGTRILGVSYAHRLSEKIAYKQRILMESDWYKSIFPHVELDKNQLQKTSFMTTDGGGRFSTSVGGTLTGEGGNYLLIDDPMNPDEALSDIKRINANDWTDQAVYSRLNDPKEDKIVVIMQRLHSDDTTGHLLENEGWTLLKLPAEVKNKTTIKLGKHEWSYEGLLHESRLDRDVLDELRHNMGSYAYAGQYLQEPVPLGGGEFKKDYLNYYLTQVFDAKPCNLYITVDPATSKKKTSDYTAMCVWALAPDQNYYLVDGIRERLNPTERIDKLFELHRKWTGITGKPPKVGYERYGMMSDTHYIQERQTQENYRFHVQEIHTGVQKEERIRRLIPVMEQGRVWLPNDIFYKDHKGLPQNFMHAIVDEEILLFPFAAHDDFLDAMSMVFDMNPIFPKLGNTHRTDGFEWGSEEISVYDL
jgi:predicted phage terminase large subunit-like protein